MHSTVTIVLSVVCYALCTRGENSAHLIIEDYKRFRDKIQTSENIYQRIAYSEECDDTKIEMDTGECNH